MSYDAVDPATSILPLGDEGVRLRETTRASIRRALSRDQIEEEAEQRVAIISYDEKPDIQAIATIKLILHNHSAHIFKETEAWLADQIQSPVMLTA
jgi:hypothetical protein